MNNYYETVFIPVKASERLPEKSEFVLTDSGYHYYNSTKKKFFYDDESPVHYETEIWYEKSTNRYIFTKEELDAYIETQVNPKYQKVDNPVLQHLLDFKHDKFMETVLWYCPEDGKLVVTKKDENAPTDKAVKMVENQMYNF